MKMIFAFLCLFGIVHYQGGSVAAATCSAFCIQAPSGDDTCDAVTADCMLGCQSGFAGTNCNIQCCPNCKNCTLQQGSVTAIVCHECVDDYYQSNGDCTPCSEMCATNASSSLTVCRETDGRCEFGCKGVNYGAMCTEQCSATCSEGGCDAADGSCFNGCTLPVLTGSKCMDPCSEGCVKRECNQRGACLHDCTSTYWNHDCKDLCSDNCFRPGDSVARVCTTTSGYCLHGCVNDTHWDTNCTTACSENCADQKCNFETGDCVDGCIDELEGPTCSDRRQSVTAATCSAFCIQAPSGDDTCNAVTAECLLGCQSGFAGTNCNIQCCPNCKNCTLQQGSVTAIVCHECVDDYYQSNGDCTPCSEMCATNASSSLPVCREMDGRCEFGCKGVNYGAMCTEQCSATCSEGGCDAADGSCFNGCSLPVLTGSKCMDSCSEGCVKRECNQRGACLHDCTPTYWNHDCKDLCNDNCFRPGDSVARVCNMTSGYCLHGCVNATHWDTNCTTACNENCADQQCNFETGDCVDGCIEEFEGPTCSDRIKADPSFEPIIIGGSVAGGVFVLVIIISILVFYCKRKGK